MYKSIVITNSNQVGLLEKIPAAYQPATSFSINGETATNQTFPINSTKMEKCIQSSDQIIIAPPILTNDQMYQGVKAHLTELIIILFLYGTVRYKKDLSLFYNSRLITLVKHGIFSEEAYDEATKIMTSMPASIRDEENVKIQPTRNTVTSIQKMPITHSQTGDEWATTYFNWLTLFTKRIITINEESSTYPFQLVGLSPPLLQLKKITTAHHHIGEYAICGGWLNKEATTPEVLGRFWFVVSPDKKYLYTALIHFKPRLPWPLYSLTQAPIHEFVMERFARYLQNRL